MRILFIGDIFASYGRRIVADHLADIQATQSIDLTIANSENSAGGFGITPSVAEELFSLGIDVMTTGNHIWDKKEIFDYLGRRPQLIRPANYPEGCPGQGLYIAHTKENVPVAVINLQGRTYLPNTDCPFRKADSILQSLDPTVRVRFVDFHAEVTSEKAAMGWYLDGRVSAVVGTHTHIPTADTRILAGGTAYQTDCGMTGAYESVIGVDRELIIRRFLTALPARMEPATKGVELHSVIVDVDETSGKATGIRRHTIRGD
jgi:metallophosphoesterase (TIGR00282 family)